MEFIRILSYRILLTMPRIQFFLLSFLVLLSVELSAQEQKVEKVFTFKIDKNIDPAMNRRVKLAMENAKEENADLIIIEMDTYGGAVNDAEDIRTMLLESPIPIYTFINKDAASAGALISIASDSIYMAPGASIGAATVVMANDGLAAPDKYQSYMRGMMRSTAEAKGRDPKIAEAMVDENIEIEGITTQGSVLTFSASEAIQHGFCEGEFVSIDKILESQGIENVEIVTYDAPFTEGIISYFLSPGISGILILVIIGGIYFELQTPGVGFPLFASIIATILYFIPYYLNGLAENWEMIVFVVGVILLAIELFVIPGFGVFGVLGIVCILTGLVLGMLPNQNFDFQFVSSTDLFTALLTVILSSIVSVVLIFWLTPKVNEWGAFKTITLAATQQRSEGYTSSFYQHELLGKVGVVHSRLRPSGRVEIEGDIYDAYSRGEFIDQGEEIIVISTEGTSLKVKKHQA